MKIINILEDRLKLELPGKVAQLKMAHQIRNTDWVLPNDVKKAAILILLYEKENKLHTILMKRTSRFPNDKHKGQISFPGGQFEIEDKDFTETALRETEEEIGINRNLIRVIGGLSELYIPVSNFLVYPYVGFMNEIPVFLPDENEVAEIIEARLEQFMDKDNHKKTEVLLTKDFKLKDVPYFDINGNVIWGATSMIMSEFIQIYKEIKF